MSAYPNVAVRAAELSPPTAPNQEAVFYGTLSLTAPSANGSRPQ
jgi:hypothetical protein